MKRLHDVKIDDAAYYERQWTEIWNDPDKPYYDPTRLKALIEPVKNGDRVLDVGAGVYGAVQYISEDTDLTCELWAIDQSYTARDMVQSVAPDVKWVLDDVNHLPFLPLSFDVVIAGEIIEHMEDPVSFAGHLVNVTKIGGTIMLSTVNTNCENAKKLEYPEHLWEYTPTDLLGFFTPFCASTSYYEVGDYHFIKAVR